MGESSDGEPLLTTPEPLVLAMLAPPRSTGDLVSRSRLVDRLDTATQGPLTLVSGEPASGKTTLAVDWLAAATSSGRPTSWLTVTSWMNHPIYFWRYLLAALRTLGVDAADLERSLEDNEPPQEAWITSLSNRLATIPGEPLVVIDDLHELEVPEAQRALATLIERLPASVHMVLLTRVKPPWTLSGLRTSGRLAEIESIDLRITRDELSLLIDYTESLELTSDDIDLLHRRTEGWVGGVKLALLSMRHAPNPSAFLDQFAADDELVSSYLFRDVLERQLPEIRDFLLEISVLDHLTPEACDFVRDRTDSGELLERCRDANLFIVEFDRSRGSFRLHSLFAQLLRSTLGINEPHRLSGLHDRASLLFEDRFDITAAIEHAIAAGDEGRAGDLMARYASRVAGLGGQFDEVNRWLSLLERDSFAEHPEIGLGLASTLCISGRPDEALGVLETMLERDLPQRIAYAADQQRGFCTLFAGRLDELAQIASVLDRAVGDGEFEIPFDARRFTRYLAGIAAYFVGDLVSARAALEEATSISSEADLFYVAPPGWLSLVASAEGNMTEATLHAEHSLRRSGETGGAETAIILPAHLTLADVAWERNDLPVADHHLNIARRSVRPLLWETVFVQISVSRLQASRGQIDDARAHLIESGQTYLGGEHANPLRAMMCRCALDLALRAGDVDDAVRWADGFESYSRRPLDPALALRLARARGVHHIDEYIGSALATGDCPVGTRIDSLLAVAEESADSGDERASRDLVGQATLLAEPEHFVRRFVDA
ncbi:MAG: hypothetical protein QNM02_13225, partial [Acidimicrobiia bacterium]|nr:hypothetical protein [Acidimicrobiia bacterium]